MKKNLLGMLLLLIVASVACCTGEKVNSGKQTKQTATTNIDNIKIYDINIVKVTDHDPEAFTQGFFWNDGYFYESTGLNNHSTLRKVNPADGRIIKQFTLPREFFAEGITMLKGKVYQLTWTEGYCFVYDTAKFETLNSFRYQGEGWGLCDNGEELIMSSGTEYISFRNPEDFSEIRRIRVTERGNSVRLINELEYINGEIWANVWTRNLILRIDPETGKIKSKIDLTPLQNYLQTGERTEVLNGIAYDPVSKKIFLTGKLWPYVFEVELVERK
ncbi:MAG: glutaminyl-peptide cyclotransferase [Chlorobi bacterium]|nr:glutaminyl-peptide cyclotransferase [Chlorobiota bacterium]